jgi:hypothetical protein
MNIADTSVKLTQTDILMLGIAALTFAVLLVRVISRALTGHLREDFLTLGEVRRTYFPTREEAEADAHYVPTEAERRKNGKAWLIFLIGCVLLAVLLLISQPTH